jgi:thymidine kinase
MLNLLMLPVVMGLYTFVLGMFVIFLGIAIIVLFVSLAGIVFNKKKTQKKSENIDAISQTKKTENEISDEIKAVIIDEVQFFDENIINVSEWLADKGLRVICGGLDCDFKGNPFKVVAELLARAESVTKLNAICNVCGQPATRTQRIIDGQPAYEDDPIILVGATEAYEPRCRCCHMVLKRDK